jgi:hypothetical protein
MTTRRLPSVDDSGHLYERHLPDRLQSAALAGAYVAGGQGITAIVKLTQAAYDAIATKSATTLYVVVG